MKIGIIRESKTPPDKRAPLSPEQCRNLVNKYSDLEIIVQSSNIRCFKDEEYLKEGISIKDDLSGCDVLMGVKAVNRYELIPGKTYIFFSHTIKKQEHNKDLLKTIMKENIQLIDYELFTDTNGVRILGFGRFGGLVGAYNGLRAFAIRLGNTAPKPAYLYSGLSELKNELKNFVIPVIRIAVTGGGRAAHGAIELLETAGVKKVQVEDFLNKAGFDFPVYAQVEPEYYVKRKDGLSFDLEHFFKNPDQYENNFEKFLPHTDMLISAAYWDPRAPVLFTPEHAKNKDFSIKVIADITCDINGSIPSTKRASTIEKPFYDYDRRTGELAEPFSNENNITVMAVDNLPGELPRDASAEFGVMLSAKVIPDLLSNDPSGLIKKATITKNGELTENFSYLYEWVNG
jgi:saccharopine dehydrogenase (NAD+, L-lysine-forming)